MARKPQTATAIAEAEKPVPLTLPERFGRPPSLTPDLADRIGQVIAESAVRPLTAARRCGIAERTFLRWTALGKADDESDTASVYAYLWQVLDQKDAEVECELLKEGRARLVGWQGPVTIASRRFAEDWAEKPQQGAQTIIQIGGTAGDVTVAVLVRGQGETLPSTLDVQRLSPPLTQDIHSLTGEQT